jgi:hypothetical protein
MQMNWNNIKGKEIKDVLKRLLFWTRNVNNLVPDKHMFLSRFVLDGNAIKI